MHDFAMSAAKVPDEAFLQNLDNEILAQAERSHQYIMEIEMHKMPTDGTETQQR
jgi:hypothetical protein